MAYIGKQPAKGNFVKLDTITTSATTTFNLLNGGIAYSPISANNCLVSLNGILQAPTDSYTISGSTIIFSSALTTSDVIDFIIVLGDVLSLATVSDSTIGLAKLTATGTKDATTFLRGDNSFAVPAGSKFGTALLHVRDEKANGTAGGTFTSGAWQTRTLNTSLTNEISGASLSSNQIILPAGTYFIYASLPAMHVNNHKAKLRNVTDSSDTLIGTNDYAGSTNTGYVNTNSLIKGRFTIASQKTFEIQHRCATTLAGEGFGTGCSFSVIEVFTDVQIWKVA
jgi:hypothetical protein